jgi:hypothetical protein
MKKLIVTSALLTVMLTTANAEYRIRDCSKEPYGASQASYEAYMHGFGDWSDPKGNLQRVCIGQSFPGSPQRKVLVTLGFTPQEIEETDTAHLIIEAMTRAREILKAANR